MSAVAEWTRSYLMLMRWSLASSKSFLPLTLIVQIMMAVGIVIGFGYLAPVEQPEVALRLSTGTPTTLLLTAGLVLVPQAIASMKQQGSFDWFRSLPAPRSAFLFSDITVWTVVSLPGVAIAVGVAALRYDLDLAPTWWLPLIAIAISATAAMVGYALASAVPPRMAMLLTQVLVFVIMLFTPIVFTADSLPQWFASVHSVLPMESMADLMRAHLAPHAYTATLTQALVVALWGIGATGITLAVMSRRA